MQYNIQPVFSGSQKTSSSFLSTIITKLPLLLQNSLSWGDKTHRPTSTVCRIIILNTKHKKQNFYCNMKLRLIALRRRQQLFTVPRWTFFSLLLLGTMERNWVICSIFKWRDGKKKSEEKNLHTIFTTTKIFSFFSSSIFGFENWSQRLSSSSVCLLNFLVVFSARPSSWMLYFLIRNSNSWILSHFSSPLFVLSSSLHTFIIYFTSKLNCDEISVRHIFINLQFVCPRDGFWVCINLFCLLCNWKIALIICRPLLLSSFALSHAHLLEFVSINDVFQTVYFILLIFFCRVLTTELMQCAPGNAVSMSL